MYVVGVHDEVGVGEPSIKAGDESVEERKSGEVFGTGVAKLGIQVMLKECTGWMWTLYYVAIAFLIEVADGTERVGSSIRIIAMRDCFGG